VLIILVGMLDGVCALHILNNRGKTLIGVSMIKNSATKRIKFVRSAKSAKIDDDDAMMCKKDTKRKYRCTVLKSRGAHSWKSKNPKKAGVSRESNSPTSMIVCWKSNNPNIGNPGIQKKLIFAQIQ